MGLQSQNYAKLDELIARSLTLDQLVTGLLNGSINTEVRTVPLPWEDPEGAAAHEALRAAQRQATGRGSTLSRPAAPPGGVADHPNVAAVTGYFHTCALATPETECSVAWAFHSTEAWLTVIHQSFVVIACTKSGISVALNVIR